MSPGPLACLLACQEGQEEQEKHGEHEEQDEQGEQEEQVYREERDNEGGYNTGSNMILICIMQL